MSSESSGVKPADREHVDRYFYKCISGFLGFINTILILLNNGRNNITDKYKYLYKYMYKNICTNMTMDIKRTGSSERGCCETEELILGHRPVKSRLYYMPGRQQLSTVESYIVKSQQFKVIWPRMITLKKNIYNPKK